MFGKGYTLPAFWATCSRCEGWVAGGATAALLALGSIEPASLEAFRLADLGPEALAEGPPDTVER